MKIIFYSSDCLEWNSHNQVLFEAYQPKIFFLSWRQTVGTKQSIFMFPRTLFRFLNRARLSGLTFLLLGISTNIFAQQCYHQLSGVVVDIQDQPVAGVAIKLTQGTHMIQTTATDTFGHFIFKGLCPDSFKLDFVATGFMPLTKTVMVLEKQQSLHVVIKADYNQLNDVEITAQKVLPMATAAEVELSHKAIMKSSGDNLGEMLKQIAGVSALQSGPTISKPAIHGLSGNRVLILNNGVRQEGQQWGDDHSPELDPQSAGNITIVKGAASVRYGADALSGVVIIDPPDLPTIPGISGNVRLMGASNGHKAAVSGTLEGAMDHALKGLSWRLQGTLKRSGNVQTPLYYLDNTGMAEGDYSATLGYQWKKLTLNASYSRYNSKIGIFSGGEVDDSAALDDAYSHRDQPGWPDHFTYNIDGGYQKVNHDVLALKAKYAFDNKGQLSVNFARQKDLRQEFSAEPHYGPDSTLLNLPDDYFNLVTNSLDVVYEQPARNNFSGSIGWSGQTENNIYRGLEEQPLIPDYKGLSSGLFGIERYETGKWLFEAGLRYDYLWRQYDLNNDPDIYRYHNLSGSIGGTFTLNNQLSFTANFGTGWRAPGADELFINGVHSSAAQFVTGDPNLTMERSHTTTLSMDYHSDKFSINADVYDNEINNFIYLNPVGSKEVDGLGYHAFHYVQDDARLLGADISLKWRMLEHLSLASQATLLRATNKTLDGGLINMPPARFQNGLTLNGHSLWAILQPYVTVENVSVLQQNYIVETQKQMLPPPPPGYSLWNISFGGMFKIGKNNLSVDVGVNNLFNTVYSDYMNQFRYFAYDLGRNVTLRASLSF